MKTPSDPPAAAPIPRIAQVGLAIAIGIAFAGFFVGTVRTDQQARPLPESVHSVRPHAPQLARSYVELRAQRPGPNADWQNHVNQLATAQPDPLAEITITADDKHAALQAREALRAYNGAPPVIPHAIDQRSADSCLICHGNGMQIGDRFAARISHVHLTNCTQCHVEGDNRAVPAALVVANSFAGKPAPFAGERAYPGAPPTIPHTTSMRDDCLSCHGPGSRLGIRSTHPWRASCTQCHAPSAELDQYDFIRQRSEAGK